MLALKKKGVICFMFVAVVRKTVASFFCFSGVFLCGCAACS